MPSINQNLSDTIAAIATPPGRGGVGIIRISGSKTLIIAQKILGKLPLPRTAMYAHFKDNNAVTIDQGICLFFPQPNSFTGEDVLELQCHGGPVVLDSLLNCILGLGVSLARPGEFTQRAFLNDKIDLIQAEAIADLIDASSQQAARCAIRSLQGEFSHQINNIRDCLTDLRIFIEAAIDFPEDEVDYIAESTVKQDLLGLIKQLETLKLSAKQGLLLQEGMTIVLVGKPNAGKSSLLNCLSGNETAIVTDIPGTTRDVLRERIDIDGLPIHVVDTAGLHHSTEIIEQEGMRRTRKMMQQADIVLLVIDSRDFAVMEDGSQLKNICTLLLTDIPPQVPVVIVRNKIDLIHQAPRQLSIDGYDIINISAKFNQGIDILKQYLKSNVGYQQQTEGIFIARRRHLLAIDKTYQHLLAGVEQLEKFSSSELLAEELMQAQQSLGEITGEFSADDLLGKIFSTFCIGK